MSRLLVANDAGTVHVTLDVDDEGSWAAECDGDGCGWVSDADRFYSQRDMTEEAGIHLDEVHS